LAEGRGDEPRSCSSQSSLSDIRRFQTNQVGNFATGILESIAMGFGLLLQICMFAIGVGLIGDLASGPELHKAKDSKSKKEADSEMVALALDRSR
jgi:hypothetical protein